MLAALRAFGPAVLASGDDDVTPADRPAIPDRAVVGRRLAQLVFGVAPGDGRELPPALAAVLADFDSELARADLEDQSYKALRTDPATADAAAAVIAAFYRRQATGGDPRALVELADFLRWDEPEAARTAYQQALGSGDAGLLESPAETGAAEDLYRRAIEAADSHWSACAAVELGQLLARAGDVTGARAAWQPVIESADAHWATWAFDYLVDLLRDQHDLAGLRAAYQQAAAVRNPEAPYALDVLGQELNQLGDIPGAHAVWQQAIDAGYRNADWLRDLISPPPEPAPEAYPAGLPPEFDPKNMVRTGLDVLDHGLPALPETLTRQMAIPIAYWTAGQCAVVLTLRYSRHGRGAPQPVGLQLAYTRDADGWTARRHFVGSSFSHDPIAKPGSSRDLDGRPMVIGGRSIAGQVTPGRPAFVATGRAAPEIRYLALISGGHEDRRPLESHFGAWVVCTEGPGPFELTGIGENGEVLASLHLSTERPAPGGSGRSARRGGSGR
jgi:tetratricopeptide (TPR) repeat protein